MKQTYKTRTVDMIIVYEHTQLCYTCGKGGQTSIEHVHLHGVSRPKFCRADIPVGWVSSYTGVYCSEECFGRSRIAKEQQDA